jgi:hypothetical protein
MKTELIIHSGAAPVLMFFMLPPRREGGNS